MAKHFSSFSSGVASISILIWLPWQLTSEIIFVAHVAHPFFQIGGVKGGHSSLSLSTRLKPKHFSAFSWGVASITNLIWLLWQLTSEKIFVAHVAHRNPRGGVQLKVPPEGPVWRRGWCVAYHFAPLAEYYPNLKSTPRFPSEVSNMTLGVLLP